MKMPCVGVIVLSAVCAVANAAPSSGVRTLKVPQNYRTISAAIAAAKNGDLVKVANGVYREQVVIDKAIRLEGTDPERTIIDGSGMNDLTGLGQVRIVAAGNVEFSKFKIINAGRPSNQYNVAIYSRSPVEGVTYDIHHTCIRRALNTLPHLAFSGIGVHATLGPEHLDLHHCDIAETDWSAVDIEGHTGPLTIRDNSLALGFTMGDPCFINPGYGIVDAPQRIFRNTIDIGTNTTVFQYFAGITVYGRSGGGFTDIQIVGNVIKNIVPNRRGINFISIVVPMRGVIASNQILGAGGYLGINVWGPCEDVKIQNNLITGISEDAFHPDGSVIPDSNGAIRLRPWSPFAGSSPVGICIEENYIEALRGISVEGDARLNVIRRNHVWASGEIAVEMGDSTSLNSVINNWLRTPYGRGNATVVDRGTDNVVDKNR